MLDAANRRVVGDESCKDASHRRAQRGETPALGPLERSVPVLGKIESIFEYVRDEKRKTDRCHA